jgi:hypothetical protein
MEIRILNQGKQLLLVPLTSRATLHLAPGRVSPPINDSEVIRNEKVTKLVSRGLIRILNDAGGKS